MSQIDINAPIKPGCLGRIVRWSLITLGVLVVLYIIAMLGSLSSRLAAVEHNVQNLETAEAIARMNVPLDPTPLPTDPPPPTAALLPPATPGPTDTSAPPTATKPPTQTPQPTATTTTASTPLPTATATVTPLPTATPLPTNTPMPPTATSSPTAVPTATPTATLDPTLPRTDVESRIACDMAERFVKDRLKAPSTAKFPGFWDDANGEGCVAYFNDGTWRISSWVDSQNSFGAQIRTHYVAQLTHGNDGTLPDGADATWHLEDLVFLD